MKQPKILVVGSINMDLFVDVQMQFRDTENPFDADIMVMLLAAKALIRPLPLLNRERTLYL